VIFKKNIGSTDFIFHRPNQSQPGIKFWAKKIAAWDYVTQHPQVHQNCMSNHTWIGNLLSGKSAKTSLHKKQPKHMQEMEVEIGSTY
jgi:hypothetical protein